MAGDEASALEEPEQVIRIGCRETIVHIGFAAQLDRRGKTGVGDREAVAEMGAQLPPGHGAGFVEWIAADSSIGTLRRVQLEGDTTEADLIVGLDTAIAGLEGQPGVLEVLALTFSGALLQGGMGLMTYDEMADRLAAAVAVILRGNE